MAGVFSRVSNILRGKTHSVLDRMENPEDQIKLFVEDTSKQLAALQKAVAMALVDEKRLKLQLDEFNSSADSWEKKAMLALEKSDENLAKQALLKKEGYISQAKTTKADWEAQRTATAKLKDSLGTAKKQIDDAKRKYNLLVAQYKTAQAKKKVADKMGASDSSSPLAAMEALNEKVMAMESEAEAAVDLMGGPESDDLDAKFAEMEKEKTGDEALAELKAKMAQS